MKQINSNILKSLFVPFSLCRQENWSLISNNSIETNPFDARNKIDDPSLNFKINCGDHDLVKYPRWKAIYMRNRHIVNNWRKRRPSGFHNFNILSDLTHFS